MRTTSEGLFGFPGSLSICGMTMLAGLILAGGRSNRMGGGTPKALIELAGATLIARMVAALSPQVADLAVNPPPGFDFSGLGLPVVRDGTPTFEGPLAGVLAGLTHASAVSPGSTHLLTAPVDLPFLPADLAARLTGAIDDADAVIVAEGPNGRAPLCALWPLAAEPRLAGFLAAGQRRVLTFLAAAPLRCVAFPPAIVGGRAVDPFLNVNAPADLMAAAEAVAADRP